MCTAAKGCCYFLGQVQAGGISARMMVVSAGTQASIYIQPRTFITTHLPRTYLL